MSNDAQSSPDPIDENNTTLASVPATVVTPSINQVDLLRPAKGTLKDYLSMVLSLNAEGVFVEPTCPFCCSSNRGAAEELWRQPIGLPRAKEEDIRKSFLALGEDLSIDIIRHHLRSHLDRTEAELNKVETINKISAINEVKVSTVDQIQILISACMERLMAIAELQAPTPTMRAAIEGQKTKDTSTIIKTMQGLLSLQASILGEMKGRGELISIPVDRFKDIFSKHLAVLQSKEEKMLVITIMEELTKANTQ